MWVSFGCGVVKWRELYGSRHRVVETTVCYNADCVWISVNGRYVVALEDGSSVYIVPYKFRGFKFSVYSGKIVVEVCCSV